MKKCPLCSNKYDSLDSLSNHIEAEHGDEIPENWSGGKYYFFSLHGRATGKCIVCGKETNFNEITNKPFRFCKNPECKKSYRESFLKNMKKAGKEDIMNDPNHQRKMLKGRKISGEYKFSNGVKKDYVGSYEKDFLQFLDIFLNYPPEDIMTPAPQTIKYKYEGKEHFYIPDMFLPTLNVLIEIKDGGDNPNNHHKIQDVDKKKEKLKDEAVEKSGYNYLKITDKKYAIFMEFLMEMKERELNPKNDYKPIVLIGEDAKNLIESVNSMVEISLVETHINSRPTIVTEINGNGFYLNTVYSIYESVNNYEKERIFKLNNVSDYTRQCIKTELDKHVGLVINEDQMNYIAKLFNKCIGEDVFDINDGNRILDNSKACYLVKDNTQSINVDRINEIAGCIDETSIRNEYKRLLENCKYKNELNKAKSIYDLKAINYISLKENSYNENLDRLLDIKAYLLKSVDTVFNTKYPINVSPYDEDYQAIEFKMHHEDYQWSQTFKKCFDNVERIPHNIMEHREMKIKENLDNKDILLFYGFNV